MAEIRQIQVDGVNYDLVISEDEVSATAAAQSAAQALAYKNQAATSATQAATSATNASNQADRAEDAASRAEQIVGGEFLSYGGDQGLDFDQQDQARENIGKATFKSASGSLVSIEHAANIPLKSLIANIKPIQTGSGDPSPSNVRPIYGHTNAYVSESRKNLFKITASSTTVNGVTFTVNSNGTVTANGTATAEAQLVLGNVRPIVDAFPNAELQFICCPSGGGSTTYKADISSASTWDYGTGPKNVYRSSYTYQSFRIFVCAGYTANNVVFTPMIFKANETDTTFEKFEGTTHSITFPSSAGTVYGGSLNVKTGVLTVTRGITDMGDLYYNKYTISGGNWFFWLAPPTNMKLNANMISTAYKNVGYQTDAQAADGQDYAISYNGAGTQLNIKNTSYSDTSAFKAAMVGVKIVHDLTTPITYQCTPTEVTALLGLNNIWADTGDVSLEYLEQGVLTEEYAKYEEERIPQIVVMASDHDNLFDNTFFQINQRQATVETSSGRYIADRWVISGNTFSWTYGRRNLTVTNASSSLAYLFQKLPSDVYNDLSGQDVTFSVLFDGKVYSVTFKWDSSARNYQVPIPSLSPAVFWYGDQGQPCLRITAGGTHNIGGIKLEWGKYSTLQYEKPRKYNRDLSDCQYYFRRIKNAGGSDQWILTGGICATTSVAVFTMEPPMRNGASTVTVNGTMSVNGKTATTVEAYNNDGRLTMHFSGMSGLTQYSSAGLILSAGSYIDISRDL